MKYLKCVLYAITFILFYNSTYAQDKLYKIDGNIEEVKVVEVGTGKIIYKRWNNQDGPDFVIPKNNLYKIVFKNGDEIEFNKMKQKLNSSLRIKNPSRNTQKYGNNMLTISPIHMTNTSTTGMGIAYERIISKNNMLSIYLPFCLSLHDKDDNNNTSPISNTTNGRSTIFWIMPGIKLYPTGNNGVVRYGVGPSIAIATGTRDNTTTTYNPQTGQQQTTTTQENVFIAGILINNSLNIQATQHFKFGIELGLGLPYYKNDGAKGNFNSGGYYSYYGPFSNVPLVQFNINLGYRF